MPLCRARHVDSDHIFFSKMDIVCKSYGDMKFRSNGEKVKVNRSKSTFNKWCQQYDRRHQHDTWQHQRLTHVSQIWHFQRWLGPIWKWHVALYKSDMWHHMNVETWKGDTWDGKYMICGIVQMLTNGRVTSGTAHMWHIDVGNADMAVIQMTCGRWLGCDMEIQMLTWKGDMVLQMIMW